MTRGLWPLHEHPSLAFEVFRAIAGTGAAIFQPGEDGSPFIASHSEMLFYIGNVDEDSIYYIGYIIPASRGGIFFPEAPGALVIRCRGGQHDHLIADDDLAMGKAAGIVEPSHFFGESKDIAEPLYRGYPVFVSKHGNDQLLGHDKKFYDQNKRVLLRY